MARRKSTVTTEENHLCKCKNTDMLNLYMKLRAELYECLENVSTGATADYVSWSIDGGRQFVNFYIQKKKIRILTLEPIVKQNKGENVPDTHQWTLKYRTDLFSEADIKEAKSIIYDSYNQLI